MRWLLRVFGEPKPSVGKGFGYFERAPQQVNAFPPECKNLPDAQPAEDRDHHHRAARLGAFWQAGHQYCERLVAL
jgi:hypothetical protein